MRFDNLLEQRTELKKALHLLLPVYQKEYNSRWVKWKRCIDKECGKGRRASLPSWHWQISPGWGGGGRARSPLVESLSIRELFRYILMCPLGKNTMGWLFKKLYANAYKKFKSEHYNTRHIKVWIMRQGHKDNIEKCKASLISVVDEFFTIC